MATSARTIAELSRQCRTNPVGRSSPPCDRCRARAVVRGGANRLAPLGRRPCQSARLIALFSRGHTDHCHRGSRSPEPTAESGSNDNHVVGCGHPDCRSLPCPARNWPPSSSSAYCLLPKRVGLRLTFFAGRTSRGSEQVVQQLTRTLAADGTETLSGLLRTTFIPAQRTANVHLAFCPPLAHYARIARGANGRPAGPIIKTAQLLPYGARLDLKLVAAAA